MKDCGGKPGQLTRVHQGGEGRPGDGLYGARDGEIDGKGWSRFDQYRQSRKSTNDGNQPDRE